MKRVKMYFSRLSVPEKIQKARNLVTRMNGNAHFTNPSPSLAEVSTAIDDLERAYEEALNGGKMQIARMRQCDSVLYSLIVTMAAYVQTVSRGDEAIILSSGFDVKSDKTVRAQTEAPLNINGKAGEHEGEVSLVWDPVPGAKAYNIQVSRDSMTGWTYCGSSTKRRTVIGGLESGAKCYFRVASIGQQGQSGWSDPGIGKAL